MGNDKEQIALCATVDNETKNITEKALLKAKISYLMKCERQIKKNNSTIVFYIDQSQLIKAVDVIKEIEKKDLQILCQV